MEVIEVLSLVEKILIAVTGLIATVLGLFIRRIDKKVEKVLDYCCGSIENDKVINRLTKIKNHYLFEFKTDNWRHASGEKADAFIDAVKNIMKRYEIDLDYYPAIKNEFEIQRAFIRDRISHYFNNEIATECNKVQDELNAKFYMALKKILMPTKNHHKERFVDACCEHLEKKMATMIKYERRSK
jgi:undecaprenyl pyrophosphate synthase